MLDKSPKNPEKSTVNTTETKENAFPTNNQLPEANLYDGICGEIVQEAFPGDSQYFTYEARNVRDYEKLERERL